MAEFELSLIDAVSEPSKMIGGNLSALSDKITGAVGGFEGLTKSLGRMIAPAEQGRNELGQFTAAVGPLDEILPGLGIAIGVVTAAFTGIVVEGAKLALEMGELREKTVATFAALSGGKEAGEKALEGIDALRSSLGMTRAELTPLASQLMAMGVQGDALKEQLTALASVKAIGIEGGTEQYLSVMKKLNAGAKVSERELANLYKTGVNNDEIAQRMGMSTKQLAEGLRKGTIDAKAFSTALTQAVTAKGADALATQAANLSNQWAIFKENIGKLFEGVNARPFLDALKPVLEIFDQSTASGKAMKWMITTVFDGIFKMAAKVFPYIRTFLLQLVIAGLKVYIAFKPIIKHFQEFFGTAKSGDALTKVITFIADSIGNLIGAVGLLVAGFLYMWEISSKAWDAVVGGVQSVIKFMATLAEAIIGLFTGSNDIAKNFIDGLINGIKNGVAGAVQAAKDMAGSMLDGVKNVLGIHSPSTVMAQLGAHTATGFAQGVADGGSDVAAAAGAMGGQAMSGAGNAQPPAGGGGATINATINITAPNGVTGAQELTEHAVTLIFERLALSRGLG